MNDRIPGWCGADSLFGNIRARHGCLTRYSRIPRWMRTLRSEPDPNVGGASMFEDSLVESRVGAVSSSKRWTTVASIALQFAVAGLVIALPLLHPETLPFSIEAPKMLLPLLPKPPAPPLRVQRVTEAASSFAAAAASGPATIS